MIPSPLRIAFLHPDLGLGGAERWLLDSARWLAGAGHQVTVWTAHRDPDRCFPEAVDGTLDVRVAGQLLPFSVAGRLRAPCAIARTAWLALRAALGAERHDVVVCDLVAHALPLLRCVTRARLVFYCHHPDRLLAPPGGALYRLYRRPIDGLEALGLRAADLVLANSRYTAEAIRACFPGHGVEVRVVEPGVALPPATAPSRAPVLLAFGRFDPQKNLVLAVEVLARLRGMVDEATWSAVRLVVAGGFDARLPECRAVRDQLEARAGALGVREKVRLACSPDERERAGLFEQAAIVLHTPEREHFGLVPVEAMAAGRPVVVAMSGGPLETVIDGETGYARAPTAGAFADAVAGLLRDPELAAAMGRRGRAHVGARFSREAAGIRLEAALRGVVG